MRNGLKNQFYVDNLVQSYFSQESANIVYQKLKSACNDAGLGSSNDPKIVHHICDCLGF